MHHENPLWQEYRIGGRLMFYEKEGEPIKVEGTLVVYAFDENGRDPGSARPDRKYIVTQQQLPAHYSKSKIGHSYSVWIPWDEVGGVQKEISLIVRFEPKNGAAIVGEQRRLLLPGKPPRRERPVQWRSLPWGTTPRRRATRPRRTAACDAPLMKPRWPPARQCNSTTAGGRGEWRPRPSRFRRRWPRGAERRNGRG